MSLAVVCSLAGGGLMVGCEEKLAETESVQVKDNGTVVKKEAEVTEKADGTIVKEESKSVDKVD
jgi:hypothetical protein